MELSKNYWSKSWGWLLSSFLVMLGFTACDDDPADQPDMYGCPTATFSIKGKVENTAGHALSGVQVITREMGDTVYTNKEGYFEREFYDVPTDTVRYELEFTDVNPQPGVLPCEPDTLKVTFLRTELNRDENAGIWDEGHAEKEIRVILKEKRDE